MNDVITTFKTNPDQLETDECLVLTDPCCVRNWQTAKEDGRYSEQFIDFLNKCAETAPDLQLVGYL